MANLNMYIRCTVCFPPSNKMGGFIDPINWSTQSESLQYLASWMPGDPWFTRHHAATIKNLDLFFAKHDHYETIDEDDQGQQFELVIGG